ncbi:hypothetical protein ACF052_32370 [Streptomyces pilosus]|uniref:hypothetical protein n=1 Tax=Streptomyces pilosus TaxID=28893 RepID=UPI0036F5E5DA
MLQPLLPAQVERSVAAATSPASRLVLALAAVHVAQVVQIATFMLDDVDLGNRRLTIAGRGRPLDDLTLKLLTDWLDHRRHRWTSTANLHLLINNQTANTPAGQAIPGSMHRTLERLRVDRRLEEALTHRPDRSTSPRYSTSPKRPGCGTRTQHEPCWNRPLNSTSEETRSTATHHEGNHGQVMSIEAAALALKDRALLWSIGEIRATDVVTSACDALVAGLDSPALRTLAACTRAEAENDILRLLPPALNELGLEPFSPGIAGQEAEAEALAAWMLAGELTPRELAFRIHRRFGHELPLAERLAELDDEYDMLEYGDRTAAQVDADVLAEALRLTQHPRVTPKPPAPLT